MHQLVRKTLETYLDEKRIITQSDIPADMLAMMSTRQSVFVTLYMDGRVIASSGRIQCQKENTVYETIDVTMLCLKDSRFAPSLQSSENLAKIHIRVDTFASDDRRMIQSASEMSVRDE
jgi:AMMECR1 domain-containing protein